MCSAQRALRTFARGGDGGAWRGMHDGAAMARFRRTLANGGRFVGGAGGMWIWTDLMKGFPLMVSAAAFSSLELSHEFEQCKIEFENMCKTLIEVVDLDLRFVLFAKGVTGGSR
eukprot:89577-Prymnesium_polylepis.1